MVLPVCVSSHPAALRISSKYLITFGCSQTETSPVFPILRSSCWIPLTHSSLTPAHTHTHTHTHTLLSLKSYPCLHTRAHTLLSHTQVLPLLTHTHTHSSQRLKSYPCSHTHMHAYTHPFLLQLELSRTRREHQLFLFSCPLLRPVLCSYLTASQSSDNFLTPQGLYLLIAEPWNQHILTITHPRNG